MLCVGCSRYPACEPSVEIADDWKTQTPCDNGVELSQYWWEVFEDPILNDLEESALVNNLDAHAALAKIEAARGRAKVAGASLYPQLNLQTSDSESGLFLRNPFVSALSQRVKQPQSTFLFNLSYEIDAWGKIRTGQWAAELDELSSYYNYYSVLLTLTGDVASFYFQLRSLDSQLELLYQIQFLYQQSLDLTSNRFNAGLVTHLDVSRARLELDQIGADMVDAYRQRALTENILAILTGKAASLFCLESGSLSSFSPTICPDLPCTVLENRPDVARAQAQMEAAHARINVAKAAYFPSIVLSGSLGFSNPNTIKELFNWQSRFWEYAYAIAQTLFDGGTIVGNIETAKGVYLDQAAVYEQTILTAIKEVEDALINLETSEAQYRIFTQSVEAAEDVRKLSEEEYKHGLVNYLNLVDAERSVLRTERDLIQAQAQKLIATVALIKAMGGSTDRF